MISYYTEIDQEPFVSNNSNIVKNTLLYELGTPYRLNCIFLYLVSRETLVKIEYSYQDSNLTYH